MECAGKAVQRRREMLTRHQGQQVFRRSHLVRERVPQFHGVDQVTIQEGTEGDVELNTIGKYRSVKDVGELVVTVPVPNVHIPVETHSVVCKDQPWQDSSD
jgi:hypothetical protein